MRSDGAARPPGAERGGHDDPGHRGRLALAGETERAAVAAAARRLLRLATAEAQLHETRWNGRRLGWVEAGAGPPVLLLHGAGGGGANWFGVIGWLAREHRVIAPDLPGFGLSDPVPVTGALSVSGLPAVRAVLNAAGVAGGLDVCGTSYGGLLAFRFAQSEKVRVRRLALADSAGFGRYVPVVIRLAGLPLLGSVMLGRPDERGIRWELRRLNTSSALPPEREAALVNYLLAAARAGDRRWFLHGIRRFTSLRGQREVFSAAELAAVRVPVLVIWGALDRLFPLAHARRAAALVPRSLLHVIPEAGHSPNWERPEQVGALLARFLGR